MFPEGKVKAILEVSCLVSDKDKNIIINSNFDLQQYLYQNIEI